MLTSDSFFSLQTQHDQSQGKNTTSKPTENKTTKQARQRRQGRCVPSVDLSYVKLSDTAALVHKNELLTPVLRADVSTGKLDSRFPVNKPQVLQIKVCWNYSSCYKSTKLNFTRWIQKHRNTSKSSQIKLVLIQTWITSQLTNGQS